jgi:hypothetical protein
MPHQANTKETATTGHLSERPHTLQMAIILRSKTKAQRNRRIHIPAIDWLSFFLKTPWDWRNNKCQEDRHSCLSNIDRQECLSS